MNVSRSGCNRSVLNDCGHILNQCEQDGRSVINECEQKTDLLSITAVYVIDPLHLGKAKGGIMVRWICLFLVCAAAGRAQDQYEGLWQGYDGEWMHVSRQLVELADAIPAQKYGWRPRPGVRSVSEAIMHIAVTNYGLLHVAGPKLPPEWKPSLETAVTAKPEVIGWLKRSLDAVKAEHQQVTPAELQRKVADPQNNYRGATVDGMYLRILVHANEHMGQLVAYARMNGIIPPWSK